MDIVDTLDNMDVFVFTILTSCMMNHCILTSHTVPLDALFVYYTDVLVPVVFHREYFFSAAWFMLYHWSFQVCALAEIPNSGIN